MRNLLIYINPKKSLTDGYNDTRMMETQIDNSLLFSDPKDIMLVTNFPYEYHGIKSLVVDDSLYCSADVTGKASKINVIVDLLEKNLLPGITWFRDLDAFQLAPFNYQLKKDIAIVRYGWKPEWNTGIFFFKPDALPFFHLLKDSVYEYHQNEEPVLWKLTQEDKNGINSKYEVLDQSFNIGMRCIRTIVKMSNKPLKVAHFPPQYLRIYERFKPLITPQLTEIINKKFYNQ